jgi:hypothetical protein
MSPKFDLSVTSGEAVVPEYFEHPTEGWLSYDPMTLDINPHRDGKKPISKPIAMVGKFFGTKQAGVPTCSEPSEGNKGCSKWAACPMKNYKHIGPGAVIMRKQGTVSSCTCYDYFETMRGGRPQSFLHYGMDGWVLDTTRTTMDVLGRTAAVESGKLDAESSREKTISSRPQIWGMEIGGLLAPWWPMMKKKGLPLPESAKHYPELTEDDEPEETSKPIGKQRPKRSA